MISDAMCLMKSADIERYNKCDDRPVFGKKGRKRNGSERTDSGREGGEVSEIDVHEGGRE